MQLLHHTHSSRAMPSGAKTARHRTASSNTAAVASRQSACRAGSKSEGPSGPGVPAAVAAGTPAATAASPARTGTDASSVLQHHAAAESIGDPTNAGGDSGTGPVCSQHGCPAAAGPANISSPVTDAASTAAAGAGRPQTDQSLGGLSTALLAELAQQTACQLQQLTAATAGQQPISIHGRISASSNSGGGSAASALAYSSMSAPGAAAAAAGTPVLSAAGGTGSGRQNSRRKSVSAKLDLKTMPLQALLSLTSAPIAVEWAADAANNPSASAQVCTWKVPSCPALALTSIVVSAYDSRLSRSKALLLCPCVLCQTCILQNLFSQQCILVQLLLCITSSQSCQLATAIACCKSVLS